MVEITRIKKTIACIFSATAVHCSMLLVAVYPPTHC